MPFMGCLSKLRHVCIVHDDELLALFPASRLTSCDPAEAARQHPEGAEGAAAVTCTAGATRGRAGDGARDDQEAAQRCQAGATRGDQGRRWLVVAVCGGMLPEIKVGGGWL